MANKLLTNKDKVNTSSLLAFRLKLLSGTLLSRQLLHDRYPSTYTDSLCPSSNSTHTPKAISEDKNLLELIMEVTDSQANHTSS
ncbi:5353_t:CDS:2, partial [Acaulospora morrowiae]